MNSNFRLLPPNSSGELRKCPSCGNMLTIREIESVKLRIPACPCCNNRLVSQYVKVETPRNKVLEDYTNKVLD